MRVDIEVLEGAVMNLVAFIGDTADGSWVFVPALYLALFYEPANRRATNLLRALRPGRTQDD